MVNGRLLHALPKEVEGLCDPKMHLDHKAGNKMYVDFAGVKRSIANTDKGEVIVVEVFVASQLAYIEAFSSQQKEDFIAACENALHFYGGVPAAIVPANLKALILSRSVS